MSDKKNPLGPTGEIVRKNVIRLRGGMQYKELAERLVQIGRPIPALGLRRIEAGERRVDADDLVALAVAFGVSPLSLLLPADGAYELASPMTGVPDREVAHNTQWLWGLGREPLNIPGFGNTSYARREIREFQVRSLPDVEPRSTRVAEWGADTEEEAGKSSRALARLMKTQGMDWSREDMSDADWAALRAETEKDWAKSESSDQDVSVSKDKEVG
ncbi:helix-turn-helix domain-containing protein [Arthrobacter sp. 135MFCol5.1]|uniref:helix-turn-helix domain-containing protein n=1 Tax=Arthrobacter sp. 135MFCol5.1 TaxID=1158050 RepID=UPI00037150D7|nr:helix-turn-helix transcriptional regulator [Arthrobacter sp. 135MFCol5.1]